MINQELTHLKLASSISETGFIITRLAALRYDSTMG